MIVMVICHYDDTNSSGGLDKQARLLSKVLRSQGENVVVLGSTRRLDRAGWSLDGDVPVRLFWTYASPQISGRYLPAALLWAAQLLAWMVKHRARIAVLHGHQIRIHAFAAALAHRLFGIPTLLKSATGGEGADIKAIGSRKYFGAGGRRFVIAETDCFVATTRSIEQDLAAFGVPPERIRVIPNGRVMEDAAPKPSAERARRALFLGRLAPDKNAPALAAAAAEVARAGGLSLDFYGKGREQAALEAAITAAGNPHVRYRGFVADTAAVLSEYGWLVLPSNAEGLSNAMIEAMTQGVVPVATRVSGCVDHIRPGETGYFLEGVDRASLVEGLRRIEATAPEAWAEMSERALRHARAEFDMRNVALSYRSLYRSLSAGA
jgi:glycosyltransferase involved in cell wall biosynthesis